MALLASNFDLDLSQLTPEEQALVLEVVRRDKDLRKNELDYIEKLQCDVDKLREFIVPENEDKCVRCGVEFWWLFRRAELCETCRKKVCANCRRPVKDAKANQCWLCVLCHKERDLRALTGAWFYQSLKFRRSKRQRKSQRNKPPSAHYPHVGTPPPVEYFFYFNFNDVVAPKDEVSPDEVDSMWNSARQAMLDNNDDNDSFSLSDISEESEPDNDESLSALVDANKRVNGLSRTGLRHDVEKNFAEVAEHNRKLLLQDRRNPKTHQKFAQIVAKQIVGGMVQMKKDYLQIQLAANGYEPDSSSSNRMTDRKDASRGGSAPSQRGSLRMEGGYTQSQGGNGASVTARTDNNPKRSILNAPKAVSGDGKPKKSVTISADKPTIAASVDRKKSNQYTSIISSPAPNNIDACVKIEDAPVYSRNVKTGAVILSTAAVVATVDTDLGVNNDVKVTHSRELCETVGVQLHSLPSAGPHDRQTNKDTRGDLVVVDVDVERDSCRRERGGDQLTASDWSAGRNNPNMSLFDRRSSSRNNLRYSNAVTPQEPYVENEAFVLNFKKPDDQRVDDSRVEFDWDNSTICVKVEQGPVYERLDKTNAAASDRKTTTVRPESAVTLMTVAALTKQDIRENDSELFNTYKSGDNSGHKLNTELLSTNISHSDESGDSVVDMGGDISYSSNLQLGTSGSSPSAEDDVLVTRLNPICTYDDINIDSQMSLPREHRNNDSDDANDNVETTTERVVKLEPDVCAIDFDRTKSSISGETARLSLCMDLSQTNNDNVDGSRDLTVDIELESSISDFTSERPLSSSVSPTDKIEIPVTRPVLDCSYENIYHELQLSLLRSSATEDSDFNGAVAMHDKHASICSIDSHSDNVEETLPSNGNCEKYPLPAGEGSVYLDEGRGLGVRLQKLDLKHELNEPVDEHDSVNIEHKKEDDWESIPASIKVEQAPVYARIIKSSSAATLDTAAGTADLDDYDLKVNAVRGYSRIGGANNNDGTDDDDDNDDDDDDDDDEEEDDSNRSGTRQNANMPSDDDGDVEDDEDDDRDNNECDSNITQVRESSTTRERTSDNDYHLSSGVPSHCGCALGANFQESDSESDDDDQVIVKSLGLDSSAPQLTETEPSAVVGLHQTYAIVHNPDSVDSGVGAGSVHSLAQPETSSTSTSNDPSWPTNSDHAVSELRQVPVSVDRIELETVEESISDSSGESPRVNSHEEPSVRSDAGVVVTGTNSRSGVPLKVSFREDLLVLPDDDDPVIETLPLRTAENQCYVELGGEADNMALHPTTGNTETSLASSSPADNAEFAADQEQTSDSVFISSERVGGLQSQGSLEIYPHSSTEYREHEHDDDNDEAFYSQSSRQTNSLSTEDDFQRQASTSEMSGKVSWTSGSRDSLTDDLGTMTNVRVSGDICLEIAYNNRFNMLEVKIIECRNLAPVRKSHSNPYVKVYLLPDKSRAGKKKTKVIKKNVDPKFDETVVYDVTKSELVDSTLWLSVWHSGRFGRTVFLGDVLIPLESYNLDKKQPKWFHLVQQGREKWKSLASLSMKSTVELSLKYVTPAESTKARKSKSNKGELHVLMIQAQSLMSAKTSSLPHAFCKLRLDQDSEHISRRQDSVWIQYLERPFIPFVFPSNILRDAEEHDGIKRSVTPCLLPEKLSRQQHGRQKTATAKRDSNPIWKQTFVFPDVTLDDLISIRSLEITVWDQERLTSKSLLGKVVLGSGRDTSSRNEETTMWQSMLSNTNEWVSGSVALQQQPNND